MSATIHSLADARRARERAPLLRHTERQRYEAELWQQRLRDEPNISRADKELAAMIGPPGKSDYGPPDGAA